MSIANVKIRSFAVGVVFALAASGWGQAGTSTAAAARKVAGTVGPAVITIRLVKKNTSSYEGQSNTRESKSEVPGVIIDPSGLVVTSLTSADPSAVYGGAAGEGMSMRSEITDARYLMPDGEEVPAAVVLRDKDFDLMFLRPIKKAASPMPFIDLKNAVALQQFDPVIVFARMGKVVNRTLGAKIVSIQGVVTKPRLRYILGMEDVSEVGCPVMSLSGKAVGLLVVKMSRSGTDVMDEMSGYSGGAAPIVLPAADVLKAAAQAPATPSKVKPSATPTKAVAPPKPK